jgi:hypothetical protein
VAVRGGSRVTARVECDLSDHDLPDRVAAGFGPCDGTNFGPEQWRLSRHAIRGRAMLMVINKNCGGAVRRRY